MFKKEDIKPGYLARLVCIKDNPVHNKGAAFYATAFTCRGLFGDDGTVLVARFENYLSFPLSRFNRDMWADFYRIDEVWGPTLPHLSFNNSVLTRNLLWRRETAKRMTLEEVEAALGHPVELVTGANK